MTKRVVITGMGSVNATGNSVSESWNNLLNGKSGIKKLTKINSEDLKCKIGGEVKNFDPQSFHMDNKLYNKMDNFQAFAFASLIEAAKEAKIPMFNPEEKSTLLPGFENFKKAIDDPYRLGVFLGVGGGGLATLEKENNVLATKGARRVSPFLVPKFISNLAGSWLSQSVKAMGINATYTLACASSSCAIGESFLAILHNRADMMITGGFEATLTRLIYSGFANMRALSSRNDEPEKALRPFDRDRDGFVMGEGGALLILEELEHAKKRGANILGEIVGYGFTNDAYHITAPEPSGTAAIRAMEDSIKFADINKEEVGYINAHGTGTKANDSMETNAIKKVFEGHAHNLLVSSTKSMSGHMLGGTGGYEAMASIKVLEENKIPPTINLDNPDEGMDLNYVPNTMAEKEINYALSNSFAFGGHNVALLFKKYKD